MNVNVLTTTAIVPPQSEALLQKSLVDIQPLPFDRVNVITQSSDVIPFTNACGNISESKPDYVRPSSLMNQDQVSPSL